MTGTDLTAAVITCGKDAYLVTEPDESRRDYHPFRFHGMIRIRDGRATVECAPDEESIAAIGEAIVPFLRLFMERVEVSALEGMLRLPDART
jgi:hypothetical protein